MHSQHYSPIEDYELPPLDCFFANRPSPQSIEDAAQAVPTIINEEFPYSGRLLICRASEVATQLQRHGHTLAAALYGLKKQIEAGERYFVLPTAVPENERWLPWNTVNIFLKSQFGNESLSNPGPFGILIDREMRIIIRQGFSQPVDLSSKASLWFIFQSVFDSSECEFNEKFFKNSYDLKGYSLDGLANAKFRLNEELLPLELRIEKWQLITLSSD